MSDIEAEIKMHDLVELDPKSLDFDSMEVAEHFIRAGLLSLDDAHDGTCSWFEVFRSDPGDCCGRTIFYLHRQVSGGGRKIDALTATPRDLIDRLGQNYY